MKLIRRNVELGSDESGDGTLEDVDQATCLQMRVEISPPDSTARAKSVNEANVTPSKWRKRKLPVPESVPKEIGKRG